MKMTWKSFADFPMESRIGVLIGLENHEDDLVSCRGGSTPSGSACSSNFPGNYVGVFL
jgi:hypothetical protein